MIKIDLLDVGNADSIIITIKDYQNSLVILVDGGLKSHSEKIINFLNNKILNTLDKDAPDYIINSHLDNDHINGLFDIINHYKSKIKGVIIQDTVYYFDRLKVAQKYSQGRTNDLQVIQESLDSSLNLNSLIRKNGINIIKPVQGKTVGPIKILGPSEEYYKSLLPKFRQFDRYYSLKKISYTENQLKEDLTDAAIIDDNDQTTPENNSSTIFDIIIGDKKFLFTGDAGVEALMEVHKEYDLSDVYWLKVPHHGSRYNLNTDLIKIMKPKYCFISAEGSEGHPSSALVSYLQKNEITVKSTHDNGDLQIIEKGLPHYRSIFN